MYKAVDVNDAYVRELFNRIKRIHNGLTIEFSSEKDGKKTMAISADGDSKLFSSVFKLVNEPKLLSKWIIVPFRQRIGNIDGYRIKIEDVVIDASEILFLSRNTDNLLDLSIYIKGIEVIDNASINDVYLLLDSAIGEYDMETKIGRVEVKPFSELDDHEEAQALSKLSIVVDEIK